MQALIYNEFDEDKQCPKILHAEAISREYSEMFKNAYIITIFESFQMLTDMKEIIGTCTPANDSELKL